MGMVKHGSANRYLGLLDFNPSYQLRSVAYTASYNASLV